MKYVYVLAACDDSGACIGFMRNDKTIESDPEKLDDMDFVQENLMVRNKKSDFDEVALQINLGHTLLPNGHPFRVVAYRIKI